METTTRLKDKYKTQIVPELKKKFNYSSSMQVPKLEKVTLSMCVGEVTQNPKALNSAFEEMTKITGQRPVKTKSKKAIANFKLRKGLPIGCVVTLRGDRMWQFVDRLISVALPRVRDFRGLPSKGFDGRGNYNMGLKEQIVFPEINYDQVEKVRGMNITFSTTAKTDEEGFALLEEMGMPFRKK